MKKIEEILIDRGYYVTEDGKLYNKNGEERCTYIDNSGYYRSGIKINKVNKNYYAHRLQAYQKYGSSLYQNGIEVRHKNGNKLDNSWNNILIGTRSENMMDIPEQIRIKRALYASSFTRKYDKDKIKKYHKGSYKDTMKKFNISSGGTLHYILNN